MYSRARRPVVGRVVVVEDRDLDVDRDAAEGVDDLLEAVEVDLDEVLDVEAVEVAEDGLQAVVAARASVPGQRSARFRPTAKKALILPA